MIFLLVLLCVVVQGAWAQTKVANEDELRAAVQTNNAEIQLTADIALSNYLGIDNGITVTLDLNGHTLSRSLSAADPDGHVIWILTGGTLTVKDSSGNNSGKLTGGWAYNGGGINVSKNSTLYFQGGTITGCKGSATGGGICNKGTCYFEGGVIDNCWSLDCGGIFNFDAGCTLTISGGTIQNCTSDRGGGCVVNNGTLTISGGTFTGNRCQTGGGGVWNSPGATMTITGGTITGNSAALYGGGIYSHGSFSMSGNPVITGNTVNVSRNNLYLDNSAVINVTGAFSEGASIGITYNGTTGELTSGFSTYNPDTDPKDIFFADINYPAMYMSGSNELKIIYGKWTDYRSSGYSHQDAKTIYIENEAELALLAYDVNNGGYIGYTFVLNKDLDMTEHYWTPIGTKSKPFRSSFEGNGHTISGIYVNTTVAYSGLFGFVLGDYYEYPKEKVGCDYIRNFVLKDSYIKGGNYTGGIAGKLDWRTVVEHVVCQADVTGYGCVGGIVGNTTGASVSSKGNYYSTVRNNLYLSGKITGTGKPAAIIGKIGVYSKYSKNYYVDPASNVGNSNDVRAYPITASLPMGVTISYQSSGITYNGTRYHPSGKVEFTLNSSVNHIDAVKVNGTELTSSNGKYSFTINPSKAEAYEISVTTDESGLSGSGTEDDPYLIKNELGWNFIVNNLNNAQAPNDFSGGYFKLAADDITINQMIGNDSHPFKGIFDGDGHTLTIAFGSADNYLDRDQPCAPFYFIDNATIKNLVIAGSIYSLAQYNGSIAVRATGSNNHIQNCISRVSINSNREGECANGGFIGRLHTDGTEVAFEGCTFAGEMLGSQATNWGGFVGGRTYENNNHNMVSFTDCLFAPTDIDIATPSGSYSHTFCRSTGNSTNGASYANCYYLTTLQTADCGEQGYGFATLPPTIGAEGTTYNVSDITAYASGLKYDGRYYVDHIGLVENAANTDFISEAVATYSDQPMNVTLHDRTLYKDESWNTLCLPFDLALKDSPLRYAEARTLSGSTFDHSTGTLTLNFSDPVTTLTAGTPYIIKWVEQNDLTISTAAEWDAFAESVSSGTDYSGKVVVLEADIEVSTMVGASGHPFRGIFNGCGHTLTVNIESDLQSCAPFAYSEDASFFNLHIAGTINFTGAIVGGMVAGLAANPTGTVIISNCRSSVAIKTRKGIQMVSGFVACLTFESSNSVVHFTDCLFDGKLTDVVYPHAGFMSSMHEQPASLTNCLSKNESDCFPFFYYHAYEPISKNCYCSYNCQDTKENLIGSMNNEQLAAALGDGWQVKDGEVIPVVRNFSTGDNVVNPVFYGARITAADPDDITPGLTAGTDGDCSVTFKGIYDPMEIGDEGDNTKLYLSSGNTLYWPNGAMTINPFRAYFQLNTTAVQTRSIVMNFGEETTTGIHPPFISPEGESTEASLRGGLVGAAWYTLDGRKMQGTPTQKGVYIKNGHLVVIQH